MKETTLCFLIHDDQVLLGMKKRGFGVGKWNGFGGKIKGGEDIKLATLRELKEETGVEVLREDLKEAGTLKFSFQDNPDWDNFCHIFVATKWTGEPAESEEMRPQWYAINTLPFAEMWIDDPYWVPLVLSGKMMQAEFLFNKGGDAIVDFSIS